MWESITYLHFGSVRTHNLSLCYVRIRNQPTRLFYEEPEPFIMLQRLSTILVSFRDNPELTKFNLLWKFPKNYHFVMWEFVTYLFIMWEGITDHFVLKVFRMHLFHSVRIQNSSSFYKDILNPSFVMWEIRTFHFVRKITECHLVCYVRIQNSPSIFKYPQGVCSPPQSFSQIYSLVSPFTLPYLTPSKPSQAILNNPHRFCFPYQISRKRIHILIK